MTNQTDLFSLKDKVIVITGATGVIGASFSLGIAKMGAKVVVMGRNKERAEQRVRAIKDANGQAIAILADVLNEIDIIRAKTEIMEEWGTIDGLVNAAGGNVPGATIGSDQNIFDAKLEDTKYAVDLNIYGTMIPTRVFGRVIGEKGRGSIVNISSMTPHGAWTRVLGYTLAKSAIEGYTRWMAAEMAIRYGDGVRVNAIAPGVFLTNQNKDLLKNADGTCTDRTQKILNKTPFRRLGNPNELNGTLIYLLSDASSFVTGEIVMVDGGFNSFSGV